VLCSLLLLLLFWLVLVLVLVLLLLLLCFSGIARRPMAVLFRSERAWQAALDLLLARPITPAAAHPLPHPLAQAQKTCRSAAA
jgi:hypothetical protein